MCDRIQRHIRSASYKEEQTPPLPLGTDCVKQYITSWETPGEDSQPPEDEVERFHVKKVVMLSGKN